MTKKKVEILGSNGIWLICRKYLLQPSGWLRYELADGTIGVTTKWRYVVGPPSPR